jgi:hypothetical protein
MVEPKQQTLAEPQYRFDDAKYRLNHLPAQRVACLARRRLNATTEEFSCPSLTRRFFFKK